MQGTTSTVLLSSLSPRSLNLRAEPQPFETVTHSPFQTSLINGVAGVIVTRVVAETGKGFRCEVLKQVSSGESICLSCLVAV